MIPLFFYQGWVIYVHYKAVILIPKPPKLSVWSTGCGCAVSSKTQQQEQAFEVMSSQLEIRAALRLKKFRGSSKFQLSKKKVQHAEGALQGHSHPTAFAVAVSGLLEVKSLKVMKFCTTFPLL